jgi:hypothetical protein
MWLAPMYIVPRLVLSTRAPMSRFHTKINTVVFIVLIALVVAFVTVRVMFSLSIFVMLGIAGAGIAVLGFLPQMLHRRRYRAAHVLSRPTSYWQDFAIANSLPIPLVDQACELISETAHVPLFELHYDDYLEDVCAGDGCGSLKCLEHLENVLFSKISDDAAKRKLRSSIQIRSVGDYITQWCKLSQQGRTKESGVAP